MPTWVLPSAALAFGLGIILAGDRAGRGGGLTLVLLGSLILLGALRLLTGRERRRQQSRTLLRAAELLPGPSPPSPRDRLLRAAGIGEREARAPGAVGPRATLAAVVGASFFLLGAGWGALRAPAVDSLLPLAGRQVSLWGTALSDLRRFDIGWGMEVGVRRVEVDALTIGLSARMWVQGRGRPPAVEAGELVAGSGTLRVLRPGEGGFEEYLVHRGIAASVSARRLDVLGPPENPGLRLANAARQVLREGAERALPQRRAGLLLGLSIGDTASMDPEVEEDFRATGLGHLLAVSGSNVAMVLAPVLGLLVALRISAVVRLAAGLLTVAFFALVTRWEPSVLRASVMAALVLLGAFAGRPRSTAAVLGGAVLVLLWADPGLARSLGFQLSVAATAGIASLAGPLSARLSRIPRPLAATAGATLGAQLAVTPLLLSAFGVVPTVTLLANLLAFPAVPPALFAGLLAAGAAHVWEPAGKALGALAGLPLGYLDTLADRLARAPFPHVAGEGLALPVLTGVVAVVAAWTIRRGPGGGRGRSPARRSLARLVVLLAAGSLLWTAAVRAGPPGELTVIFLDVGQGDSAVVRSPDGGTVLIDAGPDDQEVAKELARLGVRRIDLAVVSHAHADHVTGFPAVFARFPVGLLIEPGCPHDAPQYRRMLESAAAEGILVRNPRGGDRLEVGGLAVEVLGPDACSGDEPNDDSLVLRLHPAGDPAPGSSVLFTGDAEEPAQRDLLADGDPVHAAVLKVPHQGGATSIEEFFGAVDPEVAVVSVGPNEYGHPVAWVLSALRRTGALVLRTDEAGDVTVRFGPRGLLVESAR